MEESISEISREWLHHEVNQEDKLELKRLLLQSSQGDARASKEIEDRFSCHLEFGTAGLRGLMGSGTNRMNLAVVLQTSWGLAQYLLECDSQSCKQKGVVIGFDGRKRSQSFSEAAACVFAALEIPVKLSKEECPTPLVAF